MSSDDDQVLQAPISAGAEPQALTSSVVRASGQEELPEVFFIGDDEELPIAPSSKLNPNAEVFTPLADLDTIDFDPTEVAVYVPNSEPQSSSPERGSDGGAPKVNVSTAVNILLVDVSAPPQKTQEKLEPPVSLNQELNVPRTCRGVQYINSNGMPQTPNVEGVITPENPYGDPPPKKERPVVVHPAVDAHMSAQKGGRKRPLKAFLSVPECRLIEADFKEALDDWDPVSFTGEIEMWCHSGRLLKPAAIAPTTPFTRKDTLTSTLLSDSSSQLGWLKATRSR